MYAEEPLNNYVQSIRLFVIYFFVLVRSFIVNVEVQK